jgi:hypothetical protein
VSRVHRSIHSWRLAGLHEVAEGLGCRSAVAREWQTNCAVISAESICVLVAGPVLCVEGCPSVGPETRVALRVEKDIFFGRLIQEGVCADGS